MKNKLIYSSLKILAITLGIFFIIFGEINDSPGAELLGLILITSTIIIVIRNRNKIF